MKKKILKNHKKTYAAVPRLGSDAMAANSTGATRKLLRARLIKEQEDTYIVVRALMYERVY